MTFKNKILIMVATALLFVMPTMAEEVTIGVEVPPIANLVVLGGNTNMDMERLIDPAACVSSADDNCEAAAKFFVNTNMPKWNVYMAFANAGELKNANGKIQLQNAWLKLSGDLNVCEDATCAVGVVATDGNPGIALLHNTSGIQSMLELVQAELGVFGTNWFNATDVNTFGVDVNVGAADEPALNLAGSYTETLYITLATTY
ncbi:MAG: hypothetical protein GX801_01340 [Fibrobacter sp.]|nr:hypothetical protein [Fibrobacter sp.]